MFNSIINNRIAIDLDEVLAGTFEIALSVHKQKWYLHHLKFEDLVDHEWRRINNVWIDKEKRLSIWREFLGSNLVVDQVRPIEWSLIAIDRLFQKWFELHIITARPNNLHKKTYSWLNKYFKNKFNKVHFVTTPENIWTPKFEICKKMWINTIIEDNVDYAMELANNDIKVIILEKPWNKNNTEKHDNIVRVKNWGEIIKYL